MKPKISLQFQQNEGTSAESKQIKRKIKVNKYNESKINKQVNKRLWYINTRTTIGTPRSISEET